MQTLYTRNPIFARRAWPAGCIGRVARRASKGILHTNENSNIIIDHNGAGKCIWDRQKETKNLGKILRSRSHR